MAHYVAGVDAAASGIKVAVLDASLRGVELRRVETVAWQAAEMPQVDTPPEEQAAPAAEVVLARQLSTALAQLQLVGADLQLGFDGNKAATRVVSFPINDLRKIESMLSFELEDQLARSLDDIIFAHVPVSISKEKTDVLVATTDRAPVKALLDAAAEVGVSPRSLLLESFSLLALLGDVANGVVVDIGHTKTHVLLVANGKPVFSRTLREGGRRVDLALARTLGIDEAQARVQKEATTEMSAAIAAALKPLVIGLKQTLLPHVPQMTDKPVVYVTGGMAYLAGIEAYLTKELGHEVTQLPLPKGLEATPEAHRYTMAYALATTGALSARHPRLDFRIGELSFRGDLSGLRSQGQRWAIGALIVLALAFTAGLTRYIVLRSDENKLDDQLRQVTKTMMGREMSDFKQAITAIRQSVNPEKSVLPRFSALDYFGIVSQRIASDVDLKITEIELRQDKILMKGDATNFEMVDKAVDGLKGHECFKAVVPGKTHKSLDGQRVEFNLQIDLACGNT